MTIFISWECSGRTWHQAMLGTYICLKHGISPKNALNLENYLKTYKYPLLKYSHNGTDSVNLKEITNPKFADAHIFKDNKIIFLFRDVKDTLCSDYFHTRYRAKLHKMEISEFIKHPNYGVVKMLTAFNKWYDNSKLATDIMVITYEDMVCDPKITLKKTIEFGGFGGIDYKLIGEAVEFCKVDNLRKLENENYFRNKSRLHKVSNMKESKIRSAKVGDHVNHFSNDDIEYVNKIIQEIGNPWHRI